MQDRATILAIDDDEITRTVVKDFLEQEGYHVVISTSGKQLETLLESSEPDLVLLDVVLPERDGLTLIQRIKAQTPKPLIVISEKDTTTDHIVGLEMGADAYLDKPLNLQELAVQIKALIRLTQDIKEHVKYEEKDGAKAEIIEFGEWLLDRKKLELKDSNDKTAGLTTGEFQLLEALVLSSGRVLSREQLFELTRQEHFDSYDRAIDVQIARIRKKIGDDPRKPRYIKTVRGAGYMLDAQTRRSA